MVHDTDQGQPRLTICTDRIERRTARAQADAQRRAEAAMREADIARRVAMVSAREGIRAARVAIRANGHLTGAERDHALRALEEEAPHIEDEGHH
ncbi:hypothetical protein [Sphingomonas sp. IC4-52]|uniref:hypothetical protein n=1 Tax=Sphingomonas sp. IC4-52 TaxID=2887202 RepID=UPI001D12DB23|nr:hypothetical protein [Sphingomonas sp. IC4-52]MCC2981708.1 hypothetical protein [Sphingomonas sp. IC4-52]